MISTDNRSTGESSPSAGRAVARAPRTPLGRHIVELVSATRKSPSVSVRANPRGTLALMKLARVKALLDGRDFVFPDDVKAVAVPTLAHRPAFRPEPWVQREDGEDIVRKCTRSVRVPTTGANR